MRDNLNQPIVTDEVPYLLFLFLTVCVVLVLSYKGRCVGFFAAICADSVNVKSAKRIHICESSVSLFSIIKIIRMCYENYDNDMFSYHHLVPSWHNQYSVYYGQKKLFLEC